MAVKKNNNKIPAEKKSNLKKEKASKPNFDELLKAEKDKYLRLFAEFENYKRRTAKERIELFSTASEEVMVSLLPVLDDFDRASSEIEKSKDNEIFNGIILIKNKLFDSLKSKGLSEIEIKNMNK